LDKELVKLEVYTKLSEVYRDKLNDLEKKALASADKLIRKYEEPKCDFGDANS
jgi:hypothetical protein